VSIHKGRLCLPGGVIGRFKSFDPPEADLRYKSSSTPLEAGLEAIRLRRIWTNTSYLLTRQTGPALGSSPVDDSSACFGRHSFSKTMISGPFNSAGLKCSFHFSNPLFIYI
jgi:hypothetical protein